MVPKFRAFLTETKTVHDVLQIDLSRSMVSLKVEKASEWYWFKEVVLMQSTGLKDKNGVEIFEGDIIKILDSVQVNEIDQGGAFVDAHFDELDEVDYIVFSEGGFKLSGTGFDVSICHDVEEFKVIGNIWENLELLEQANEN